MDSINKLFHLLDDFWGRYAELDDGGTDLLPIQLLKKDEFDEAQFGYRVDDEGKSLIDGDSDWQAGWYVIGMEENLGDPLVVDMSDEDLPVFTIMHDAEWTPQYLAGSLQTFLKCF